MKNFQKRETLRTLRGNKLITHSLEKASGIALKAARKYLKRVGGKRNILTTRDIP